jgi:Ser/Thr protein kinase RdoA (MazF antagonist)
VTGPGTERPGDPVLPTSSEWSQWGVSEPRELHAGHQSRVLRASLDGLDVAVKLTDRRFVDRSELARRMEAVATVARSTAEVVGPVALRDALVQPIGGWWMTASPFADGSRLDVSDPADMRLMGVTVARLHSAMAHVPCRGLPAVAALRAVERDADRTGWQLLHGDLNIDNLIITPVGVRIVDFDDCGVGPVEFDVANALYMVLFDAKTGGRPERYDGFRTQLLAGYSEAAPHRLDTTVIDDLVEARIRALGRWLDDLDHAPIGIRTSSPEWLATLRAFVRSHASDGQ